MTDDDDHDDDDFVFYKSNDQKIKHSEESLELKPAEQPKPEPEIQQTPHQYSSPEPPAPSNPVKPPEEPQKEQDDTIESDDFALDIPTETEPAAPQKITGKVVFTPQHDEPHQVQNETETEIEAEPETNADNGNEQDQGDEGFLEELEAMIQAEKTAESEEAKQKIETMAEPPFEESQTIKEIEEIIATEIEPQPLEEPEPIPEPEAQNQQEPETILPESDSPEEAPEPEIQREVEPQELEFEQPQQKQKPKLAALNKEYIGRQRTVNKSYSNFVRNVKYALPILAAILIILTFSWNKFEDDQITPINEEEIQPEMRQEVGKNELLNPRFESVDSKGRPFSITAQKVIQENGEKGEMLLEKPSGTMALDDEITLTLTSDQGAFNQIEQYLDLENNVNLTHSDGYRLQTRMMHVDLENNTAWSDEDVTFTAPEGKIDAKGITASSEEKKVIFKGPAKMIVDTKKSNLGFGNLLP